ncbi:hypothetical protein GCM10008094_20230 [Aidingimonas halophila]|nr:hypothetical protein GCM10008094_20230 [Aidingimonas halophila]
MIVFIFEQGLEPWPGFPTYRRFKYIDHFSETLGGLDRNLQRANEARKMQVSGLSENTHQRPATTAFLLESTTKPGHRPITGKQLVGRETGCEFTLRTFPGVFKACNSRKASFYIGTAFATDPETGE